MEMKNDQQAQREARHIHDNREELAERIAEAIREDGTLQPLTGLHLSRTSVPLKRVHSVVESSVAVIAQGSKEVLLGESRYHYDPSRWSWKHHWLGPTSLYASPSPPPSSARSWLKPLSPYPESVPR